jgi:hypothetical protein
VGAAVGAAWRIRGEAASKTLRLERREAGKWALAASFQLGAGMCRPDAPKVAEPEQP